jgi:hypothetical protein
MTDMYNNKGEKLNQYGLSYNDSIDQALFVSAADINKNLPVSDKENLLQSVDKNIVSEAKQKLANGTMTQSDYNKTIESAYNNKWQDIFAKFTPEEKDQFLVKGGVDTSKYKTEEFKFSPSQLSPEAVNALQTAGNQPLHLLKGTKVYEDIMKINSSGNWGGVKPEITVAPDGSIYVRNTADIFKNIDVYQFPELQQKQTTNPPSKSNPQQQQNMPKETVSQNNSLFHKVPSLKLQGLLAKPFLTPIAPINWRDQMWGSDARLGTGIVDGLVNGIKDAVISDRINAIKNAPANLEEINKQLAQDPGNPDLLKQKSEQLNLANQMDTIPYPKDVMDAMVKQGQLSVDQAKLLQDDKQFQDKLKLWRDTLGVKEKLGHESNAARLKNGLDTATTIVGIKKLVGE